MTDTSSRQLGLLDMPLSVLEKITTSSHLDIEDRRHIALCCKTLLSIVRSVWRVVQWKCSQDNAPPPGLEFFTRLHTVVWALDSEDVVNTVNESEWDTGESMNSVMPPNTRGLARIDLERWGKLNQYLAKCMARRSSKAGSQVPTQLRLLVSSRIPIFLYKLASALPDGQIAFDEIHCGCVYIEAVDFRCPSHADIPNAVEQKMVKLGTIWQPDQLMDGMIPGTSYWPKLSALRFLFRPIQGADPVIKLDRLFSMLTPESHASLRELYIGELSIQGLHFFVDFSSLQLTNLTKLVLNGGIQLSRNSFKSLCHLVNLHTLDFGMSYHETQPLLDLETLGADHMPNLRCLRLEGWCIYPDAIDISSFLTQLTELELSNMTGIPEPLARTMAPMPNLKGVSLSILPWQSQWRFQGRDSRFPRWFLPRIQYLFPNAEVVHIGTLGGWPRWIESMKGLTHAASTLDEFIIQQGVLGEGNARAVQNRLMYLQVDAVFAIENEVINQKCESNRMPSFERTGLLNGEWDRSLEFKYSIKTEIVTIEFHYSRRSPSKSEVDG